MHWLLPALLISISFSAEAASPWAQFLESARNEFRLDRESETGKSDLEPIGYLIQGMESEYPTVVYFMEGENLTSYSYDCHYHSDSPACHKEDRLDLGAYAAGERIYNSANFVKALEEALAIFIAKVAPEKEIRAVKIWEASKKMNVAIRYTNDLKSSFFSCHFHRGTTIDCHRERSAGPNEPKEME